jgi:putative inorganic carbon (HCO3(-)) transporter
MINFENSMRNIGRRLRLLVDAVGAVCARFTAAAVTVLVVALPLVVSPWGEDAYNQVKALTMYALAGTASLAWLGTRLITGGPKWRSTIPELAVWAFLLAVLLSSVTSVNPRLSYFGTPGRYEGLLAFASYAALFFVGVHFFGSRQGMRSLVTAAGVAAAVTAGYGVLQMFVRPLFRGEAFIRDWYGGLGMPRVSSTLGSPVVFGGYLSVMIPLLLALAVLTAHRHRVLWLAAACLSYVAAVFTLTRAAWLGVAIGTVVLVVGRGGGQFRRVVALAVVCAVLVAGLILRTAVGSSAPVGSRMASVVDPSSGSLVQRLYIWDRTITLVRARPWLGWGLETLGEVFPYDRPALVKLFGVRPVIVDKAHNDVLQMAVSVGVPGALAYIAFWAAVVLAAFRLWKREADSARLLAAGWLAAIVGYLVQIQFSFSAVALAPIVWVLAGSAAGWEAARRETE